MSVFDSRWVTTPDHVTELDPATLAPGFRAAGVAAGIKPSGALDLGMLVCDAPDATSDARFTATGTQAPPVLLTRERTTRESIRAIVVNSGNANAATGRRGYEDAARMQGGGAMVAGVAERQVAVCSTGVIGVPLPMGEINRGIAACARALSAGSAEAFAQAIRTTDVLDKHAAITVILPSGPVTVSAQCKGAGMLLGVCLKRSFERISVDGQLSTNDTVILQASGASGVRVEPESADELALGEAIDALMRGLALRVVRDGEGARRVGRVTVRGGDPDAVERAARAVADSPLVKTALYGGDPNWGRIIQAVGAALPGSAPLAIDVSIAGVPVCVGGVAVAHDSAALVLDLAAVVAGSEVEYEIALSGEGAEAELYFSDLGHEYVTINAEYTT
jgi:glutamate N-acetyltransferase/amino-acid N-acetyltransferase